MACRPRQRHQTRNPGQGRVWIHGLDAETESDARHAAWEQYQEQTRNWEQYWEWQQVHGAGADLDAEESARWRADDPQQEPNEDAAFDELPSELEDAD